MKSFIKVLAVLFLTAGSSPVFAQQIEIVVVGSSHENPKGSENFDQVISKLKQFKPDMVFGEFLSGADNNQLDSSHWAYQSLQKRKGFIARRFPEKGKNLDAKIEKANRSLSKFAYFHKQRMDLAADYIKQADIANGEYQLFVLENYMKGSFGAEEKAYYESRFGNRDSLVKARLYYPESEYSTIYFPLIYALKQNQIYSMDCQKYDKDWSAAWGATAAAIKALEKKAVQDSTSAEAKTLAAIERYSSLTADDQKMRSKSPYQDMSTDRYAQLNDAWNFYGGSHFYGYAGFPDADVKEMYAQWTLRNEGMCANVLRQAKAQKARRVVIGVGAAHRKIMEEILAKDPAVKIVSYAELL